MLSGYTILGMIGRGGAAVVYVARQDALDRQVAIKVLRLGIDENKVWERFRREARTIARLSGHPNVVTVYTADRSSAGEPYLVTEYLDRGSLADIIVAEGPLPAESVLQVGVAIAEALAAAHGLGILHRDVKPGNVLLGRDGRVKLGDFGIARLLAGHSGTSTDTIAFTPEHVAPEVLRGQPEGVWSDVYGLASTLATALLGTPPFRRRPDERMESLLTRKIMAPPPPFPAWVPCELAGLLARALDREPSRRPSLAEFRNHLAARADALRSAIPGPLAPPTRAFPTIDAAGDTRSDGRDGASHSPPVWPIIRRRPNRRHWLAIAALVITLVSVVLAVALIPRSDRRAGLSPETGATTVVPIPGGATGQPTAGANPGEPIATAGVTAATAPTVPATTAVPAGAPATAAVEEAALITAEESETFVRSYFDAVAAGDYDSSWSRLAPEFKRGMAVSYDYYVDFWNSNDVEVGDVELVDADHEQAVLHVELRWNGNDTAELNELTLRADEDGDPLIASQDLLG